MFVLLEHNTGSSIHWDFIIEVPGRELLPTWRLLQNPLSDAEPIDATAIADHPPHFLDYEGDLSRGLGSVRRLDRGEGRVEHFEPRRLTARLDGRHLRGRVEILTESGARATFRRTEDSRTES